ncbi:MAG: Transcriptional regulatory protein BaeR [Alphaproteobacteria bacterium MarineAlpha5_Bin12]|nr:DNA-binding response regulator [Pelagibacteraceae bacterium]PPR41198.1 MAG: Transcriptional regulatory protein BaeR [Alphaproteobacteria bacterium MarineAlpha5_Bin12]|tara:strand:+ start:6643 stop:7362 length:720 start_codon:yes stop_codon:yes gene_type:complete
MFVQNKYIAIVDDERNILTSVSLLIRSEGYDVKTFENGEDALNSFNNEPPSLALLDIKMPRMNGRELLIKIRDSKNVNLKNIPIIFLTSKDDEQDEILGLRIGAADYITKPFKQKLLLERIKTVLRIYDNRMKNEVSSNVNNSVSDNDLFLDDLKHLCFWKNKEIELTVAEFKLVKSLAKNPGVKKNRDQLMDAMYGENIYVDDRTIDSHIKRLRKKFKIVDKDFEQIQTKYGLGYSWK